LEIVFLNVHMSPQNLNLFLREPIDSKMSDETPMTKQKILFLCTGNSCRSQMAEGWARHFHDGRFEVWSAGLETHGLNPLAVQAMQQAGVDISAHHSKLFEELQDVEFDLVITVCGHAGEHCPLFTEKTRVIHHGFEDPPRLAEQYRTKEEKLAQYKKVCEEIRKFVRTLYL